MTLVELILVLVLLGILLSLSVPQLKHGFQVRVLEDTVRRAVEVLRYAQYRAVARGEAVVVMVDSSKNRYQLMKYIEAEDEPIKLGEVEGRWGQPIRLERRVNFDSRSESVVYFPDGTSAGGLFLFKQGGALARVLVRPGLGSVEVKFERVPQ